MAGERLDIFISYARHCRIISARAPRLLFGCGARADTRERQTAIIGKGQAREGCDATRSQLGDLPVAEALPFCAPPEYDLRAPVACRV